MRTTAPLLVAALVWLLPGASRANVTLSVSPLGLVDVSSADGLMAEFSPAVLGPTTLPTWDIHGFMFSGTGADLFGGGQTILLAIRDGKGKTVKAFGQLSLDPANPRVLRFVYRFTLAQGTPLRSVFLRMRLPHNYWAGQRIALVEGTQAETEFPKDAPGDAFVVNEAVRGIVLAAGTPHEMRLDLDAPQWLGLTDDRTWNPQNTNYAIALPATVPVGGAATDAGQMVEVSGVLRFAEPLTIASPSPADPQLTSSADWQASVGALGLGIDDAAGHQAVGVDIVHDVWDGEMGLEPTVLMQDAPDEPGAVDLTGQVFGAWHHNTWFSVLRRVLAVPGEPQMRVSHQLTASGDIETYGVYSQVSLARPLFDGCTLTFLGEGRPTFVLRDYYRPGEPVARALAPAVRIDAGGKPILTLTAKPETAWDIRVTKDAYLIKATLLDPQIPFPFHALTAYAAYTVRNATTLHQELTLQWGG